MGEYIGVLLMREVLETGLTFPASAILSMAIKFPDNLHLSNKQMGSMLNVSEKTIRRAIILLLEKSFIKVKGNTSARVIISTFDTTATVKKDISEDNSYGQYDPSTMVNMTDTSVNLSKTTVNMTTIYKDRKNKKINRKEEPPYYQVFLDKWNTLKELPSPKESTVKRKMQKKHKDIITDYTEQEVLESIDNYYICLTGDKYFTSYCWTFWDFIVRGLDKYMSLNKPLSSNIKFDHEEEKEPSPAIKEFYERQRKREEKAYG